mmetsp:Transcript_31935/g.58473  ORF Transcript_31935/g.58473 Transcript_31935/m.58473 type:complete len:370 (-) Transcript_31935:191-1300(-)
MQVSHQMNEQQVDAVLTEFNATTTAVRGIEEKMERAIEYMVVAQTQQEQLTGYALQVLNMIDVMGKSLQLWSDDVLETVSLMSWQFASLVEMLELTLMEMGLVSVAKELQTEMWPLLVPVACLVIIVSGSNCAFGFQLAADPQLLNLGPALIVGNADDSAGTNQELDDTEVDGMNLLNLFAIFHVVLICVTVLYVIVELARKFRIHLKLRRCKKKPSTEGSLPPAESNYNSMDSAGDEVSVAFPSSPQHMSSSPEQASPPGAEQHHEGTLASSPSAVSVSAKGTGLKAGPVSSFLRHVHEASWREVQRRKGDAASPAMTSPRDVISAGKTRRRSMRHITEVEEPHEHETAAEVAAEDAELHWENSGFSV